MVLGSITMLVLMQSNTSQIEAEGGRILIYSKKSVHFYPHPPDFISMLH
jgi:hypothetical protein